MNLGHMIFKRMQRLQGGTGDVRYTPVTPTKDYPYSTDYEFIHRKVPDANADLAHLTQEEQAQEQRDWEKTIQWNLSITPNLTPEERNQVLQLNPKDWDDSTKEKVGAANEKAGTDTQLASGTSDVNYNPSFDTPLDTVDETLYRLWKKQYAPSDSGDTYDYRGAYAAGQMPTLPSGHWTDRFKKPNYPTFSQESQYAGAYPEKAGTWRGDTFIPAHGLQQGTGNVNQGLYFYRKMLKNPKL